MEKEQSIDRIDGQGQSDWSVGKEDRRDRDQQ